MWRSALFISLFCSITLNIYLFMQLSVREIEKKLPQENHVFKQKKITNTKAANTNIKETKENLSNTKKHQQASNKIKVAINEKDYFTASFLIKAFTNDRSYDYETETKIELSEIKSAWLQKTKVLIEQNFFTEAEASINAYLEYQPDDIDFLYQQIALYKQQNLTLEAIKYAYELQYHVDDELKYIDAINFSRALVQQQIDLLINKKLWLELRDFVDHTMVLDPEYLELQWLLASAQYELGEFHYAHNALEPLLDEPNYKVKAHALLTKIESALRKPENIPLIRQGEHFIVQALLNDDFEVSLMLDTGASISLISEQAFETLSQYSDVTYMKDIKLSTAGGQVTASIYQIPEINIQGYIVNDIVFAVSPFTSDKNDGLLGMNFLKSFDFHIDQDNSQLILKNK